MRLALLPGLDGTGLLFEPLLAALPTRPAPLVVSYPSEDARSLATHVDAAVAALSGDESWVIVAESFSGPVAARLAQLPDLRIAGIVFCASFITSPRPLLLALAGIMPIATLLGIRPPDLAIQSLCLGAQAGGDLMALFRRAIAKAGTATLSARLRLLARLPPLGPQIAQPCLYIRPTADRLVPRSAMLKLKRQCRQIEVATIGGPHFILQAAPVPCADAIRSFVDAN